STGKQIARTKEAGNPARIAFAGDGKTLTSLSRDGRLRIWETATGKLRHEFAAETGAFGKVALSGDGQVAATISRQDEAIHLWNVAAGKELHRFAGHRHGALAVAFAADGKSVLTTSRDSSFSSPARRGADWSLRRWDFQAKELDVWPKDQEAEIRFAVFAPTG